MLEFGQGTAPAEADIIKDTTEANFMADVVDASQEVPVIVDFWAPWCGPCKQLTPVLEQAVREARGKVRLVKLNVDEAQNIAGQLRIQSIPAVYAFIGGRPVDGFMGAQSAGEIKRFIERLISQAPAADGGLEEALAAAEQMLEEGAASDAAQTFAAIMAEEPENMAALAGLARAHIAMGDADRAQALIDGAPEDKKGDPAIAAVQAQLELARVAAGAGEIGELAAKVEAAPDDLQARYDLAMAHVAAGQTEKAIDELLEVFRRDREWNDGAAKSQLIKLFDALGPKDPVAQRGRRRLSSMIFA